VTLTFPVFKRQTDILQHKAPIAVLLVLLIAGLAPACIAGWTGDASDHCGVPRIAVHKKAASERCKRSQRCAPQLRARAGRCGFRSFLQLQFAQSRPAVAMPPRMQIQGKIALPPAATLALSSIGSPHTDRGPPRS